MTKIKIFNIRPEERAIAKKWSEEHQIDIDMTEESLTLDNVSELSHYDGVSLLQNKPLDARLYGLIAQEGIHHLAQRSAGFDSYDLSLADQYKITISNVPSYSPESIAEFTILTTLMLVRKMPQMLDRVQRQDFRWHVDVQGKVLREMTVGVVGTGHIGRCVAEGFKGLGCHVQAYDPYPSPLLEGVAEYTSLTSLIQTSDIVTLHIPATPENHHQFNDELFQQFKKGAYFINAARGSIVDTKGLINALNDQVLTAAALDTYEYEAGYVGKNWDNQFIEDELLLSLLHHPKILYTPHLAYFTEKSVSNMITMALDAVLEFIQTGTTKNKVN